MMIIIIFLFLFSGASTNVISAVSTPKTHNHYYYYFFLTFTDMRRDVQEIFRNTPHSKQVMMFSATLSRDIRPVCKKFMQDVINSFHTIYKYFYPTPYIPHSMPPIPPPTIAVS